MNILRADRFDLIPATAEFLQLLVANDPARAGKLLDVIVPLGWPDDEDARAGLSWHLKAVQKDPAQLLWRIRLIVLRSNRTVIGSINLKGPPDESGTVEIGWGISEEFRRQGMATEAAAAVVEWVLLHPNAKRVIATIPSENTASIRVAERLGMQATEEFQRGLRVWALDKK